MIAKLLTEWERQAGDNQVIVEKTSASIKRRNWGSVFNDLDYHFKSELTYDRVLGLLEWYHNYIEGLLLSQSNILFEPYPNSDQMKERVFLANRNFYHIIGKEIHWGRYVIKETSRNAYYTHWIWINHYPTSILFNPYIIHYSRRYAKRRWLDRLFALNSNVAQWL